jgi:hypothetical protein
MIGSVWMELRLFRVVLRLSGTKNFQDRPEFCLFFKSNMNLIYFPKFDPLTATGTALCVNLGPKCQNLFP